MTPSQCFFAQQITQNLNYQRKKTHKILGFLLRSGNLFLFFFLLGLSKLFLLNPNKQITKNSCPPLTLPKCGKANYI